MMAKPVFFDHIEVHVNDISKYSNFLKKIFGSGRCKVIAPDGTSMFKTKDGLNIEIKKICGKGRVTSAGFCNPGLRMKGAKNFIEKTLKCKVSKITDNPDGKCYFLKDHEGITWHIKDYLVKDKFVDW